MARRGKATKVELLRFETNLMCNIMALKHELETKTYQVGQYRKFKVHEPKERDIMSLQYRDRIVQHVICDNIIEPMLEPRLIYDNAACRKGKGTHFALDRLNGYMRKGYNKWGSDFYALKCDVHKYFYSIDHDVLRKYLYRYIADEDIRWLLDVVIDSTDSTVGLPIGNMTSQWFAVFYLDALDRFIKEELKIKMYVRYMDDFIILHNDKKFLQECLRRIREFLYDELKLELNEKTQILPIRNGVDYIGFHSYLTDTGKIIRKLRKRSKAAMKRKIKKFNEAYAAGELDYMSIQQSVAAWMGHAKHGNTYYLRKNILGRLKLRKDDKNEKKVNQYINNYNNADGLNSNGTACGDSVGAGCSH